MAVARRRRRRLELPGVGVDVGSALDLVGGVLKWMGAAFAVPAAVAIGYGDPAWPSSSPAPSRRPPGWRSTGSPASITVRPSVCARASSWWR
jgi:hypothetical protein